LKLNIKYTTNDVISMLSI